MELIEHILGICGDHWHINIYHIVFFLFAIFGIRLWQKKV